MSSKFSQMQPLVSMATDRVTVGKTVLSHFSKFFNLIHFILAGNDDIHKSLNEFEMCIMYIYVCELYISRSIVHVMMSSP